jgi:hypothetical protein
MVDTAIFDSKGIAYYLTALPKWLTENITNLLRENGLTMVTEGWSRILLYTVSVGLIFLVIKISKPVVKYLFLMLLIILILGFWVPF